MSTEAPRSSSLPVFAFLLWCGAAVAAGWLFLVFAPAFRPVFESLEVELPLLTVLVMDIGGFLRDQPWALALAALGFGASMLPFVRREGDRGLAKRYLVAGIALWLVTLVGFAGTFIPISKLQAHLDTKDAAPPAPR